VTSTFYKGRCRIFWCVAGDDHLTGDVGLTNCTGLPQVADFCGRHPENVGENSVGVGTERGGWAGGFAEAGVPGKSGHEAGL
jgi:hypothetical protein